ncbi:hypothetical protein PR048_032839 [Dryococelus australis]|uniref:Uncharacterized protein n=1 Tax=Dryococelus australis TaxID=614101 RepID=A0ABQ9G3C9_9NEOP|nr:hypothetical protein PR048_032839 [Dryococelus australis]
MQPRERRQPAEKPLYAEQVQRTAEAVIGPEPKSPVTKRHTPTQSDTPGQVRLDDISSMLELAEILQMCDYANLIKKLKPYYQPIHDAPTLASKQATLIEATSHLGK